MSPSSTASRCSGMRPGLDLREIENVVDQREQVLRGGLDSREALFLPVGELAVDAVEQQRRVSDERVDRRAQLVRHAREKFRFEPVGLLELARLPLQPHVLLREIGRRRAHARFELAAELLQLFVQPLVLGLLGEIVQHRHDRDRLAAPVHDLARHDLDRDAVAVAG